MRFLCARTLVSSLPGKSHRWVHLPCLLFTTRSMLRQFEYSYKWRGNRFVGDEYTNTGLPHALSSLRLIFNISCGEKQNKTSSCSFLPVTTTKPNNNYTSGKPVCKVESATCKPPRDKRDVTDKNIIYRRKHSFYRTVVHTIFHVKSFPSSVQRARTRTHSHETICT